MYDSPSATPRPSHHFFDGDPNRRRMGVPQLWARKWGLDWILLQMWPKVHARGRKRCFNPSETVPIHTNYT